MFSQVAKWGNSLAVRLPKKIAETIGISLNTQLKIEVKKDKLIFKKSTYSLDDMVNKINTKNCHSEIETKSTGKEIW
jgi:antitoxin MazE